MSTATITMTLGATVYTIPTAPIKRTRAWRQQLKAPLDQVLDTVAAITTVQLNTAADLSALATQILPILFDTTDTLLDLIFAYAPALTAQRDVIEDTALDAEVVDAFMALLKAAFPLVRLLALRGPATPATSTNSPAPNGA
ncbi:MAG: hypothetical protein WCG26_07355 [Chloroflexales bacterium]